ncbi:MAG: hypothetical protein AB7N71_01055 [Phycisphaerae bacterium]
MSTTLTRRLEETTYKPSSDKSIAQDGTIVVLRSSSDDAYFLAYKDGSWRVTRHVRFPSEEVRHGASLPPVGWRGRVYVARGSVVTELSDDDSSELWQALYADLLSVHSA